MMKRKFVFLLLFLFFSILRAGDDLLIVNQSDGSKITYLIKDIKKITFDTTLVNIDGEKLKNVLRAFTLFQNYPNPFNPSTTIEYNLPEAGDVEIRIFNMNGQLVRSFSANDLSAGINKIVWDGKNEMGATVASGLYVCKVKFENLVVSKKMILIR